MKPFNANIRPLWRIRRALRALVIIGVCTAVLQPIGLRQNALAKTISYERGIGRVKSYIARKQYRDAEELLSAMLKGYPGNPEILALRGRVLFWSGEPDAAIRDFKRSLRRRNDPAVRRELARVEAAEKISRAKDLISQGKTADAEAILTPLFAARHDRYEAGLLLGRMYSNAGSYEKARDLYGALHEEYPHEYDITYLYVRSLIQTGEIGKAEQVVALLPAKEHPSLYLARAAVAKERGEYTNALESYRQALKLHDDPSIRTEMQSIETLLTLRKADAALTSGRPDLTEKILRPLYDTGTSRYESGMRLARLYQKQGEFGRAAVILGELRKDFPADKDLMLAHLDALLAAGDLPSVERELAPLADDRSPQVSLRRGRLMYRLKRYDEAVKAFRAAGDTLEPTVRKEREAAENALALNNAQALMRAGKQQQAVALWDELYTSDRERYESGYQLGMAYLRQRNFAQAREHFTCMSDEFPKDPGLFALAVESNLLARDVEKAAAMVHDASPDRTGYLRQVREDLLYRVRPNFAKISGLVAGYDNGISTGRELALTISQRIAPATVVMNAATIHRYGTDDAEFGAEVTSPLRNSPFYGTLGFTYSPDARFLPRTTFRGEGTYVHNGLEYSLGYTRMNFDNDGVNIVVLGVLDYLKPALSLNERLYVVPDKGTFSLLSTLNYEPTHRLRCYYSLGLDTASETIRERNAVDRYFTVTNRLGIEYRPIAWLSGGSELFEEYRNGLYNRYGIQLFVRYWW